MRRESHYVKVARLAYRFAQAALPKYKHSKSPHTYSYPQLSACVVMMLYLQLSYRDMEEWLLATDRVCAVLGLVIIPDHSTLCRTYHRLRLQEWETMQRLLLACKQIKEQFFVADTTNYRLSQASAYYMTRTGRKYRDWVKGGYIMALESRMIVGWRAGRGASGDQKYLNPLRRQAARYGQRGGRYRGWTILADMGFDGEDTLVTDLIPPNRRGHDLKRADRIVREEQVALARTEGFWGQRWQIETVMSVIKRKFGDTVRSRSTRLQRREAVIKSYLYNLRLLWCVFVQIAVFATEQLKTASYNKQKPTERGYF